MKCNDHSPADEIFNAALELDTAQRGIFLERACAHRPTLLEEVQSLLRAYGDAVGFLETPVIRRADVDPQETEDSKLVGTLIGPYRLLSLIAAGGMGAVYKARREDNSFHRQVAVKLIRRGMINDAMRRRFHRERQTLAALEHPLIARLLDGGDSGDGIPYLVMELISGLPITDYCEYHGLSIRERLRIFSLVCDAVYHAHRNLIVHRDLKPGNILVTEEGTPKLLDFGIARLIGFDGSEFLRDQTQTTSRAMTPRYASPEQIHGGAITTGTDVYSLGVILYELLTGRSPYLLEGKSRYEQDRIICEVPPAPPSALVCGEQPHRGAPAESAHSIALLRGDHPRKLARLLRGDLDKIVLTALNKDPNRRYSSAQQFKEDVERYLAGLPIVARKVTLRYRAMKYVMRNKAASAATAAFALATLIAVIGTSVGFVRARSAQQSAQHERNAAIRAESDSRAVTAFMQDLLAAANPYSRGREATVGDLLSDAERRISTDLGEKPAIEAGVRYAIANTYAGMWHWDKTIPHLRVALSLNRRLYGHDDPRVADCLSLLGRALTFARDPEAIAVQEEALAIRMRNHGPKHPAVAESTGNLGFALWHSVTKPRWARSEELYRQALAMYRDLNIHEDSDVARFTFSLAAMLSSQSRYSEAEPLFRESLAIYENLPVPMDRYRTECMRNYASMLERAGRFAEADAVIEKAIAIAPHQELGAGFRSLKWALGALRNSSGRSQEALELFRSTLADSCLHLAESRPEEAERLKQTARQLQTAEFADKATADGLKCLMTLQQPTERDACAARINLAAALNSLGKNETAVLILEPVETTEDPTAETRALTAMGRSLLGLCLAELGEFSRAEPLLMESHLVLQSSRGNEDHQTRMAAQRIDRFRKLKDIEHQSQ